MDTRKQSRKLEKDLVYEPDEQVISASGISFSYTTVIYDWGFYCEISCHFLPSCSEAVYFKWSSVVGFFSLSVSISLLSVSLSAVGVSLVSWWLSVLCVYVMYIVDICLSGGFVSFWSYFAFCLSFFVSL